MRTLNKWAGILSLAMIVPITSVKGADQTISGNLTVTGTTTLEGNADMQGDTLSAGTRVDTLQPGWGTIYTDGTSSSLEFDASRSANTWKWQQNAGSTLQVQMSLGSNNALTLYDQSSPPVAKVVLNPTGTSTFASSLTMSGTDNEMPNQTLVNSNSVLTQGLGDSRYLSSGAASLTLNGTDIEMPNQTLMNSNSVLTTALANSLYLHPDTSGNVGIGTTTPNAGLDVENGSLLVQGTSAAADYATLGDASYFSTNQDNKLLVADDSGSEFSNSQFDSNNPSGRTSIIVSNSAYGWWANDFVTLAVNGPSFAGNYYPSAIGASSDAGKGLAWFQDNSFTVLSEVLVGSYDPVPISLVSNNSIVATFNADGSTDFSGKVGVGTTAPTAQLEVNGNAQVDGTMDVRPGGDLSMGNFTAGTSP